MIKKVLNIEKSLDILGIKSASKKVLLAITDHGTSTASDIASRLNMPKSSVYDSLSELAQKSLVTEYSDDKWKTFGISEKEQLTRVHKEKIEELQEAHSTLISFMQNHSKRENVAKPKIKFYSGTQGMKQAFRDITWNKKYKETYLMWPLREMLDTLGVEFLKWHSAPRIKHSVVVNAVEKHSDRIIQKQKEKYDWLENNLERKLNRIRYAPKNIDWQMSYWIYGDKCLFASGGSEKFAFTIQSKEFCQMMELMWKQMWNISKE